MKETTESKTIWGAALDASASIEEPVVLIEDNGNVLHRYTRVHKEEPLDEPLDDHVRYEFIMKVKTPLPNGDYVYSRSSQLTQKDIDTRLQAEADLVADRLVAEWEKLNASQDQEATQVHGG